MPLPHNGLIKLSEECGEVIRAAMKLVNYPEEPYPEHLGDLRLQLQDELADVVAAMCIVTDALNLDLAAMEARTEAKIELFRLAQGRA